MNDRCNNSASATQVITTVNNIAPVLNVPANVNLSCGANAQPTATGNATATASCNATVTVSFADVATNGACADGSGSIARNWTAVDSCGNRVRVLRFAVPCSTLLTAALVCCCLAQVSGIQLITFTVVPPPPPTANLTIVAPANITVPCNSSTLPAVTGSATASGGCSNATVAFVDVVTPGACNGSFSIVRQWTASDTYVTLQRYANEVSHVFLCYNAGAMPRPLRNRRSQL